MYTRYKLDNYKINFLLRIFSCFILSLIPSFFLFEILPAFILPLWSIVLIFICLFANLKKIKLSSSIIIIIFLNLIFWFLLFAGSKIISNIFFDILYLRLQIIIPFIILQVTIIVTTTTLFLTNKKYGIYEPLLFLSFFSLLFFSQRNYSLSVFEHPKNAVIFALVFFLIEINRIFLSTSFEKRKIKFFLFFIPIMLTILLFILKLYNQNSTARHGGLLQPTIFQFDFSDFLQLQDEIKLKDDLALIAKFNSEFEYSMLRRLYLSGWDSKKGFFKQKAPDEFPQIINLPKAKKNIKQKEFLLRTEVKQEYFFINISPRSLIAMDYPTKIIPYKIWNTNKFNGGYKVTSQVVYSFAGDIYGNNAPTGNPKEGMSKKDLDFYTYIDNETKKLVYKTGSELTENIDNYLDKVLAIQNYFTDGEYKYSLKPGRSLDGNQLKYFLQDSKKGYCTYFAFAFTLMLRSIGIPARVAVGFFVQPDSQIMGYYPIRQNMAHAWTEVFFPEIGWISFDATTENLAEGENLNFGASPGGDDFNSLLTEILENRNKIKMSELNEKEDSNLTIQAKELLFKIFNKHFSKLKILILIIIIFIFVVFKTRHFIILKFSKNNRKIILTAYKIFKKQKQNILLKEEMERLKQKAKFAPKCDDTDVKRAIQILKENKRRNNEK